MSNRDLPNRVQVGTATTGDGSIVTLGAALSSRMTFAEAGFLSGTVFTYYIEEGTDFELGVGTYMKVGSVETLDRNTPIVKKSGGVVTEGSRLSLGGLAVVTGTIAAHDLRKKLQGDTNLFVRYNIGVCTMSIATPSVVTTPIPHLLAAGDAVVFSLPTDASQADTPPSISIASPGVLTFGANHGYANDDPILLRTSGSLPTGLTPETLLFVRNKTDTTFEMALTAGGASINTTGAQVGYVKAERWSLLPTGVTAGTIYYVLASGLTSTQFQFSATAGGAAINTTGTQRGKITLQTGKDTNSGLLNNQSNALLTIQRAWEIACEYDKADKAVVILPTHSKYLVVNGPVLNMQRSIAGYPDAPQQNSPGRGGKVMVWGDEDHRDNVVFSSTNERPINVSGTFDSSLQLRSFTLECGTSGFYPGFQAAQSQTEIYIEHMQFRGSLSGCIELYEAKAYLHGMFEIIGLPVYNCFAQNDSIMFDVSFGNDYFPGIIAYGVKAPLNAINSVSGNGYMLFNATIQWEGVFNAPRWRVSHGGRFFHTPYAPNTKSITTVGTAPQYYGGSFHEWGPSGLYTSTFSGTYYNSIAKTVATLEAAGTPGRRAFVTDANSITYNSVVAGGGSNAVMVKDDGSDWLIADGGDAGREILTADRNYYVRYNLGACSLSIGTPCTATRAAHGLSIDDPVVFTLPLDASKRATISNATPGVVTFIGTYTNHGYENNDPVKLYTTGALPTGLSVGTTYYVRNKTTTTFELSLTSGGASIATSSAGSGYHRVERASTLPTGVTEGFIYYVVSVPTANTFTFSQTVGGSAVNTSGTTIGKITLQTGNNDNTGLIESAAGAMLTPNAAIERALHDLDFNNYMVVIELADSMYLEDEHLAVIAIRNPTPSVDRENSFPVGGGTLKINGNEDHRGNVILANTSNNGSPVFVSGPAPYALWFRAFTVQNNDPGWFSAFYFFENLGATPYLDHLAVRGTSAGLLECHGTDVQLHGMFEITATISGAFIYAGTNSSINYIAPGADYFPGVIAFGSKAPFSGTLFCENAALLQMASNVQWKALGTGPKWKIVRGARLNYPSTYTPPGTAGVIFPGGSVYDYTTSTWSQDIGRGPGATTVTGLQPAATAGAGARAFVTDATATTFLSIVAGSGANKVPVVSDGTNWLIG